MNIKSKVAKYYYRIRTSKVARKVRKAGLTYLSFKKIYKLEKALHEVKKRGCPGDVVEAGVARGGAGIVLAKNMGEGRRYWGYDSFESMPVPSEEDGAEAHKRYNEITSGNAVGLGGKDYYGYENNLLNAVRKNFEEFGLPTSDSRVNLIPGYFENTFEFKKGNRVALAHVDCDWYESVNVVLSELKNYISEKGTIVIDDYNDYDGAKKATKEFLEKNKEFRIVQKRPNAIIKKS